MLWMVETADSPSDGLQGPVCGTQSAGGKTLTEMAGSNKEIMSLHHIHHNRFASVTANSWLQQNDLPRKKLQSIPEPS